MSSMYYRNVDGLILVYDITNMESFKNLEGWIENAENNKDVMKGEPQFILVGNKIDLEDNREVATQEGQDYADSLGIKFFEISVHF